MSEREHKPEDEHEDIAQQSAAPTKLGIPAWARLLGSEIGHLAPRTGKPIASGGQAEKQGSSAPAPESSPEWKQLHNYVHPGNVTARITLFHTTGLMSDPSGALLIKATAMLGQHGLKLDTFDAGTLDFGTVSDMDDVLALRMLAHKTYQDTKPRLPIIVCRFSKAVRDELNGLTVTDSNWLPFVLINADQLAPDSVTGLHEMGHAAGLGHYGTGPNDVVANFMTYDNNRTDMLRFQVIAMSQSYYAR